MTAGRATSAGDGSGTAGSAAAWANGGEESCGKERCRKLARAECPLTLDPNDGSVNTSVFSYCLV